MSWLTQLVAWFHQAVTDNLGLKTMAFVMSLGLFGYIHGQEDVQQRTVPVSVISLPPEGGEKELMTRIPASIHITMRASNRSITALIQDGITPVEVDLREGYPLAVDFTREMFVLPRDVELVLVDPPRLDLEWEEVVTRQVQLQTSLTGAPAEGRIVKGEPRIEPERVIVRGPVSVVSTMQFARLAPYVVTGLTEGSWARRIAIEAPPARARILGAPAATVTVDVVREQSTRVFASRPVEVVGPHHARVTPTTVDVTVTGPPEVIALLREEQVIPRADLTNVKTFADDGGVTRGSASVPIQIHLSKVDAETQPPSVTVKW